MAHSLRGADAQYDGVVHLAPEYVETVRAARKKSVASNIPAETSATGAFLPGRS